MPRNHKISDYWNPSLATNVPTVENGDVKVTFDVWWLRYKDKNPTPTQATSGWDQIESVDTPDDFTVVVHWKSVLATYLQYGSGPYGTLPAHLLEKSWAAGGDITSTKLQIQIPGGFRGSATWNKVHGRHRSLHVQRVDDRILAIDLLDWLACRTLP